MLEEALSWCAARAAPHARRLGYVAEAVAIKARYRRCKADWRVHLQNSKQAILTSISRCHSHRCAVVLGAGSCLDIPLKELSNQFEQVILVDVVQLPGTRLKLQQLNWQGHSNIEYVLTDVTGALALLQQPDKINESILRQMPLPLLFKERNDIDWLGSINILSQLPLLPMRWLQCRCPDLSEQSINQFGLALMRAHVDYLKSFTAEHLILFDIEQWLEDAQGNVSELVDLQSVMPMEAKTQSQWLWALAPQGEMPGADFRVSARHRVAAYHW